MKSKPRKHLYAVLRLIICAGLLWFVIQGVTIRDRVTLVDGPEKLVGTVVDHGDYVTVVSSGSVDRNVSKSAIAVDANGEPLIQFGLASTWRNSSKWMLLFAVLIHLPVILPQALRFQWLIGAQGIAMSYWECLKLAFAGNFLNFAAPLGSNAGDVFKAYFASLHTADRKTEAVATVILDRLIGLGSLVLVVALITLFVLRDSRLGQLRPYILTMFAVGLTVGVAYLLPWWGRFELGKKLIDRLPMADQLRRLDRAARVLASHVGVVIASVLLTILLQAMAMLAYFVVAAAVGLAANGGNIIEFFAYFYTGVVVQALPGPPQGLGTVELTYRYFFEPYGGAAQIVCMALAIRLVALTCALPGLFVAMTGAYRPRALAELAHPLDGAQADASQPPLTSIGPNHLFSKPLQISNTAPLDYQPRA